MTEPTSNSISIRLRRCTVEEGYVDVPVTADVMKPVPEADGSYRVDGAKVLAEAVRLGSQVGRWQVEEQDLVVHPVQRAHERTR